MKEESESTTGPNWPDLPSDLTANILQRLGTLEIVTSACRVCPQWWNICKDPLMWRTIHMCYIRKSPYAYVDLWKICCFAIELSCGHLEDIVIKRFCTNDLLKCIADHGSQLRCMRLVNCRMITDKGFSKAVRKLPQLEKVDISHCCLTDVSLEALGRSCPLLKLLKYHTWYSTRSCDSDKMALAIAETMPGLCHLDMKGHQLTELGVLTIIDKCPLLESLDIRDCHYLNEDLEKRCIDQINDVRMPRDNYDDDDDDYDEDEDEDEDDDDNYDYDFDFDDDDDDDNDDEDDDDDY